MIPRLLELLTEAKVLTLYHGTQMKHVPNIKSDGVTSKDYSRAQWYMVSSDFESALFHANPSKEGEKVPVVKLKIPVTNKKWEGYPYLWPPTKRSDKSKWYALKEPIPKEFIKKIYYVSYDGWLKQKGSGF